MTAREFYSRYIIFARESERTTRVPALFTLAQAALETGWGNRFAGVNNFFGIKDTDGVNGNESLVLTTEYNARTGWRKIKQYFRKYKSPADSFTDHGLFLRRNKRYASAFLYAGDPVKFAEQIAKAGYATDPKYFEKLCKVMRLFPVAK